MTELWLPWEEDLGPQGSLCELSPCAAFAEPSAGQIQDGIGEAVNNIVKHFHKPEKEVGYRKDVGMLGVALWPQGLGRWLWLGSWDLCVGFCMTPEAHAPCSLGLCPPGLGG